MADDGYAVVVQQIAHVPMASATGGLVNVTRVTIKVGSYGPFSKDFAAGQDSTEIINAWKLQQVQQVKLLTGY